MKDYKEQVKIAYDAIAKTFSHTRDKPWVEMDYFKEIVTEGSIIDLGCGNGRIYDLFMDNPKIKYTGVDFSEKLIELARDRYKDIKENKPELIVADMNEYKIKPQGYDAIFLIASYHHILDKKERMVLLKNISQGLKDNGIVILTVWNLWNSKTFKKVLASWGRKVLRKEGGGIFDINYPFNDFGKISYRPYKMFTLFGIRSELKKEFSIFKEERWKKGQNLVFYMRKK